MEYFLSLLIFFCGDFTDLEKAFCVDDMSKCQALETKEAIYQCAEDVYLDYFKATED